MSYIDMNFMLVNMIPTMKNLINGKVISPGSKHTVLQKISQAWTRANTSSADPLGIKTCAFDTRFPDVLAALKEEGAACARNPDTQHLFIDQGKVKILDITAFSLIQWLLRSNGADASPSVGASMYAAYFMLQKRIGIRACQESANILKRHFTEDNSYGWPVLVQQSDLPTKNHKLDRVSALTRAVAPWALGRLGICMGKHCVLGRFPGAWGGGGDGRRNGELFLGLGRIIARRTARAGCLSAKHCCCWCCCCWWCCCWCYSRALVTLTTT
jgi:hypothetical protein